MVKVLALNTFSIYIMIDNSGEMFLYSKLTKIKQQ